MRSFALLVLLAACVKTNVVPLGSPVTRPPVQPDSVLVYREAGQVPGKYTEVAIVTAEGDASASSSALLAKLRAKAGEIGANAILLQSISTPKSTVATVTNGTVPVANAIVTNGRPEARAVAIFVEP